MLQTPPGFQAVFSRQDDPHPLTFMFRGNEMCVRESDVALPSHPAEASSGYNPSNAVPVGTLNGRYCQAVWLPRDVEAAPGFVYCNLRALFGRMDDELVSIAGRAYQIAEWTRTHQFCGACTKPMHRLEHERCMRCAACGHMAYPRISPAMMVLIRNGDRILLARHAGPRANRFSPLAGFLEAGESIEEAIHREVFEEVGLRVKELKYFGSQSWPFPHSLMVAYTAEYASGEIKVQEDEIAEARWFGPDDEMPHYAKGTSISGELIEAHWPGTRS